MGDTASRAELARYGYAVFGRTPQAVFPAVGDDEIREAARAELVLYWAWAVRRPWMWLDPIIADLGLTSMARGRHALGTGDLLTKGQAIEKTAAPAWLTGHLRACRRGQPVTSPRLRTAWIAWYDAYRPSTTPEPAPRRRPPPAEHHIRAGRPRPANILCSADDRGERCKTIDGARRPARPDAR